MKKMGKVAFITVLFFAFICFFSCVHNVEGSASIKRELTAKVANYNNYINIESNDSARTIVPPSITNDDFTFWLLFSKANVEDAEKTVVKVSAIGTSTVPLGRGMSKYNGTPFSDGKFTIILENCEYLMTLYAVRYPNMDYSIQADKEGTLKRDAFLHGTSYIDLRNEAGTVVFNMTEKNLPGRSSLDFDVVLDKWDALPSGKVSLEIRDLLTNEEIKTADDGSTKEEVRAIFGGTSGWLQNTAKYGDTSYYYHYSRILLAGTYNFNVTFWNSTGSEKLFSWSDIITVLPNRNIETPVYLAYTEPIAPVPPTDFKASYVEDSQNPVIDEYEVYFEWTDSDNYEDYFEMELLDVSADKSTNTNHLYATTDTEGNLSDYWWDAFLSEHNTENISVQVISPYEKAFMEEGMYKNGGMWGNSTNITLVLSMGKRYLARIRAINNVGASDWAYIDLRSLSSPSKVAFDSETINMYKIVYHLNEGRYSTATDISDPYAASEKAKYSSTDFIVYGIQDKTEKASGGTPYNPVGVELWDGIHIWDSDGSGTMTTQKVGGSLKKDASASAATNNDGDGARDNALLGGLWTKFDTDGDLEYDYTKDENFGLGSLQKVKTTRFHDSAKNDIAAFKYWVNDVSKDSSDSAINAAINKYPINVNYKGFENLELWAKYYVIKDPSDVPGATTSYDDPKAYDIYSEWMEFSQSATSGSFATYRLPDNVPANPVLTLSKANGNYVSWQITIPTVSYANSDAYADPYLVNRSKYHSTEAYGLTSAATRTDQKLVWSDKNVLSKSEWEALPTEVVAGDANDRNDYTRITHMYGLPKGITFDSVTGVLYKSGSYEAGWASSITSPAQGTSTLFAEMDISKLISGQTYRIVFTANYGKYTYQKSVEVNVRD